MVDFSLLCYSTRSLYTVMDPEETPEVKPVKTSTSQKKTVLIDLVDSDCEVTEVFKTKPVHKPPREMTVSEKLRILKQVSRKLNFIICRRVWEKSNTMQ